MSESSSAADAAADLEWFSPDEGEQVEWVGQPAQASLLGALLIGLLFLPVMGFGLLIIVGAWFTVQNTDYVATNRSLYVKKGILSTNVETVDLDRIQNTNYSQSFLGKQLGYGTVEIATAGSEGSDLSFRAIEDASGVRDLIRGLSAEFERSGGGASPGVDGAAAADPMSDLADDLEATRKSLERIESSLETLVAERDGPDLDADPGSETGGEAFQPADPESPDEE